MSRVSGSALAGQEFADRIDSTYRQAASNGWGGIVAAACLSVVMWGRSEHRLLVGWLIVTIATVAARVPMTRFFFADPRRATRVDTWASRYALVVAAHGACWGAASFLFLDQSQPDGIAAFLIVLTPVVAGSIASQSLYLPSVIAFMSLAMLPAIVRLGTFQPPRWAEGGTLLLFYAFLHVTARAQNRSIRESYRLRRSNADLIERLRIEKDAAEAQRLRAERASESKTRFVAIAGHDLRQPMHALGLFAGSLRDMVWNPGQRRLIDHILSTIENLQSLTDELLDLSRMESGHVDARMQDFPLLPLLSQLRDMHEPAAQDKGLQLSLDAGPWVVRSDPALLGRLLGNLIANAIRYTEQGRIRILAQRDASGVRIAVEDSGVGIHESDRERIFEEFVQLDRRPSLGTGGLGLGLAIVRRIGLLLGTPLEVASEPGRGSTFAVVVAVGDAARLEPAAAPASAPLDLLDGRRVLVIDDDPIGLGAIEEIMVRWGCVPACAASAQAACSRLAEAPPDLIVTDLHLGGDDDGIATVLRIRALAHTAIPAVVMTGDLSPRWRDEAGRHGLVLLHKPVRPAALRAALCQLTVDLENT